MKLFLIIVFYLAVFLGFTYASVELFRTDHPTPAWFSLVFAFLSIPNIRA